MRFYGLGEYDVDSATEGSSNDTAGETGPRVPAATKEPTDKKKEEGSGGLLNSLLGGGGGLFDLFGKLCGKSGDERAKLANDAGKAAGPPAAIQPIPYPNPTTPEQVAANDAVIKANQAAMASNQQRDDFIQKYIDSNATIAPDARTIAVGDAYHSILVKAKGLYGEQVGEMSMMQLYAAHPDMVEASYAEFQQKFPILQGVSFQQFMSTLPDSMKNVSLNTLDKILPNSTKNVPGKTGGVPGGTIGIGIGVLLAVALLTFILMKKKKGAPNAP